MSNTSSDITIIYYTNNVLDEEVFELCRKKLIESADGKPIISVSQKPIELGKNICMGDIGSSWLNLYKQLLKGAESATTKYVATAEHDCLYTKEHFNWRPPTDDVFYYNENVYFVQWKGNHPELEGMYSSYWEERRALSQLICNRNLLIESIKRRLELLDQPISVVKKVFAGEPGCSMIRLKKAQELAKSGSSAHLSGYLKDFIEAEKSDIWRNEYPNLDIRHNGNFTGPKRGKNRTYELAPWGKFKDLI